MAEAMRAPLGQPVVIENVSGASGNIATGRVAHAAPDGYTLVLGSWPTHVLNAGIFTLPYDPLNDFESVGLVAAQPLYIEVRKDFPANTLAELIAWLKANPGKATQATAGSGGASHVAGVFFQQATGTQFQMVPYRGSAPAVQDLIAGPYRHDARPRRELDAAGAERHHQGACGDLEDPAGRRARCADGR